MTTRAVLESIQALSKSKFGQPSPRHGLELLFWFATDYIKFPLDNDNKIDMKYNPKDGDFGFHPFENRIDDIQGGPLLPAQTGLYYEVGNLHSKGANTLDLPPYVKEKFRYKVDESNTDRLIIGLNSDGDFSKVYVTKHKDQKKFSRHNTYQISQSLLYEIHKMSDCEAFLKVVCETGKGEAEVEVEKGGRLTQGEYIYVGDQSEMPCCLCTIL